MSRIDFMRFYDEFAAKYNLEPRHHEFEFDQVLCDGNNLHLDILCKDSKAPVIIFIPGTATYSLLFGEILLQIHKGGYTVVGFDPRGHGRSDGKRGSYTIPELIRDTHAVIHYARNRFHDNVSILGCSQGGIVAFYTACIDEKIRTVICQNFADLGSKAVFRLTPAPRIFAILNQFGAKIVELFPEYKIPISSYLPLEKERVRYYGNVKNWSEQDPFALTYIRLKTFASLSNTPLPKRIEEFNIPICVLQAGRDSVFPLNYTQYLFDKLQCEKELVIMHGLQHVMFTENPDSLSPVILKWLDAHV